MEFGVWQCPGCGSPGLTGDDWGELGTEQPVALQWHRPAVGAGAGGEQGLTAPAVVAEMVLEPCRAQSPQPRSVVNPAGRGCDCTSCTPSLTPQRAEPQREAQEGAEDSCATSEHTRLTKQWLITGKVLAGKQRAGSTPKAFPQLLSGFGPCIDTEEQHQWGRGSHPQAHTAPRQSCTAGQGQALARQHPQSSLVPPEQAAGLAWGCRTVLPQWSSPWLNSPGMHCLGQGESRDRPQLGWRGARSRGALPQGAPAAGQPHSTHRPTPRGQGTLSPGPQCIHWKGGRKRRGVYTFENCQPCRVMGDPNRITRQTCILPSILK